MAAKPEKKEANTENQIENCFIITPIGAVDSETFRKTKGLISSIIAPVLEGFNFKPVPAYEINNSGSITKQILKCILNDKIVIANLTGLNPNVMYELAVRHAVRLPVITMAEYGTSLPFDISNQRTIFYHDTLLGSEDAKPRLTEAIKVALNDQTVDNPIYEVTEEKLIIKESEKDERPFNEYLLQRFDRLENALAKLNSPVISKNLEPIAFASYENKLVYDLHVTFHNKDITRDEIRDFISKYLNRSIRNSDIRYYDGGRVQIADLYMSDSTRLEMEASLYNMNTVKEYQLFRK